jgi:hypothetical protein
LKAAKSKDNKEAILAECRFFMDPLFDKASRLESAQLLRKAHKLGIEVPDTNSWWEYEFFDEDRRSRRIHLSEFGKIKVAKLIREERVKNAEQLIKLVAPIIAALTGLVGAIIGLLAFIWSIHK